MRKPQETPPAAEHAALIVRLRTAGLTLAAARQVVGASVSGRTRGEINAALILWLRARPKG
jgi:hypothetical protein